MLERTWKVAVIDSGLAPLIRLPARRARRFVDEGDRVIEVAPTDDHAGHGSLIAGIIASSPRPIELVIAQVLDHQGCGTAAAVAAAVDWAHAEGADLLHLSLGMPQDRPVLRASIGKVVAAGRVVVASSPARGSTAYPAAYPGVIRATGDARCGVDEISCLRTGQADFGACPVRESEHGSSRGASVGAAHLTRYIVTQIAPGSTAASVREALERLAAFHGREMHRLG